jgi:hypothetical protein
MDITSGEMYFRIKNAAGLFSELPTFNAFLRTDIDGNHQKSDMYAQQRNMKNSRMHMRKDMVSKLMIAKHIRLIIDSKRYVKCQFRVLLIYLTLPNRFKTPTSLESRK